MYTCREEWQIMQPYITSLPSFTSYLMYSNIYTMLISLAEILVSCQDLHTLPAKEGLVFSCNEFSCHRLDDKSQMNDWSLYYTYGFCSAKKPAYCSSAQGLQ